MGRRSCYSPSRTTVSSYAQSSSGKQSIPHPCEGDPVYHKLDFWVGKWDVYDNHDGTLNGTDIVEKIVGGCALDRKLARGRRQRRGQKSFLLPASQKSMEAGLGDRCRTDQRKTITRGRKDGSIRFQGEIPHPDGESHLDRTTLTPLAGGRVHQVIEISRDAGKTWKNAFDADYRPRLNPSR